MRADAPCSDVRADAQAIAVTISRSVAAAATAVAAHDKTRRNAAAAAFGCDDTLLMVADFCSWSGIARLLALNVRTRSVVIARSNACKLMRIVLPMHPFSFLARMPERPIRTVGRRADDYPTIAVLRDGCWLTIMLELLHERIIQYGKQHAPDATFDAFRNGAYASAWTRNDVDTEDTPRRRRDEYVDVDGVVSDYSHGYARERSPVPRVLDTILPTAADLDAMYDEPVDGDGSVGEFSQCVLDRMGSNTKTCDRVAWISVNHVLLNLADCGCSAIDEALSIIMGHFRVAWSVALVYALPHMPITSQRVRTVNQLIALILQIDYIVASDRNMAVQSLINGEGDLPKLIDRLAELWPPLG